MDHCSKNLFALCLSWMHFCRFLLLKERSVPFPMVDLWALECQLTAPFDTVSLGAGLSLHLCRNLLQTKTTFTSTCSAKAQGYTSSPMATRFIKQKIGQKSPKGFQTYNLRYKSSSFQNNFRILTCLQEKIFQYETARGKTVNCFSTIFTMFGLAIRLDWEQNTELKITNCAEWCCMSTNENVYAWGTMAEHTHDFIGRLGYWLQLVTITCISGLKTDRILQKHWLCLRNTQAQQLQTTKASFLLNILAFCLFPLLMIAN